MEGRKEGRKRKEENRERLLWICTGAKELETFGDLF
jgi:hypothetical protein